MFLRRFTSSVPRQLSMVMREKATVAPSKSEDSGPAQNLGQSKIEKTMNQVMLLGRVGADPQKRGSAEHPVVIFSLATHANYQYASGDMLQKTDWHRICVFKPFLRDTVYKFMSKGQRVMVQGRIAYGEVKDEHGTPHVTTSIVADDVTFFSKSSKDEGHKDEVE